MPILPYTTTEVPLTSLTPHPSHLPEPPQPGQNNPPQEESGFADSSGPLFSMYLQLAGDEDKKMTENWKGDADGILIFVSCQSMCGPSITHIIHPEVEDWFILRRRSSIGWGICAGPQAKFPGHFSILPRKHLSNPRQFEWLPGCYPPHTPRSVHPIFSTNFCRMGQLTLVSQLGHQPHVRSFGHITAAMGASVHEGHTDTIQPTQTSADPGVLCGGRRKTSPSVGSRSVACVVTRLSFPILRGPRCVPFQYQSYGLRLDRIVGWDLYRHVPVHHVNAYVSA